VMMVVAIVSANTIDGDTETITNLTNWTNMLLWQAVAANLFALFTDCKAWPIIMGLFSGLLFYLITYYEIVNKQYYGTTFYTGPVQTLYLDDRVWPGLVNIFVTFLCHMLLPDSIADMGPHFETEVMAKYCRENEEVRPLTNAQIQEEMKDTVEPVNNWWGRIGYVVIFLLCTLSLPWYDTAYNGCDYTTYVGYVLNKLSLTSTVSTCPGPELSGDIPVWAQAMLWAFVVNCFLGAIVIWFGWQTQDSESFAEMFSTPLSAAGEEVPAADATYGNAVGQKQVEADTSLPELAVEQVTGEMRKCC